MKIQIVTWAVGCHQVRWVHLGEGCFRLHYRCSLLSSPSVAWKVGWWLLFGSHHWVVDRIQWEHGRDLLCEPLAVIQRHYSVTYRGEHYQCPEVTATFLSATGSLTSNVALYVGRFIMKLRKMTIIVVNAEGKKKSPLCYISETNVNRSWIDFSFGLSVFLVILKLDTHTHRGFHFMDGLSTDHWFFSC